MLTSDKSELVRTLLPFWAGVVVSLAHFRAHKSGSSDILETTLIQFKSLFEYSLIGDIDLWIRL